MRYVIVGNGVAGTTAAMTIRGRDSAAAITMISGENEHFFSRTALMYAFMDRMSLRDLEPFERKVYDRQAIRCLTDWVTDLDAGKQTLTLRSGSAVTYDKLLLTTGSVPNRPPLRGLESLREGLVNFVSMQDLLECERLTPSTDEAVVVGGGLIGGELVECLAFHGKKVTFLVREPYYWPTGLGEQEGMMIAEHINHHGIDLHLGDQVEEVYADSGGRVRGVRTASGAEFSCQMLGVAVGVRPAIDWLRTVTTPPALDRGIRVSPSFVTSLEDVYAAGDCAEIVRADERPFVEQIWYSAKRQGALAAQAMLGDPIDYRPPLFYNSAKFFDVEYTTVGAVNRAPSDAIEFYSRVPGKYISVRVVAHRGAVIGFNMLGSRWRHTFFERWVAERRSMDYVIEHLASAQFDVEFGRQDLSAVQADYQRWKHSTPSVGGSGEGGED